MLINANRFAMGCCGSSASSSSSCWSSLAAPLLKYWDLFAVDPDADENVALEDRGLVGEEVEEDGEVVRASTRRLEPCG
jgi:hypothetical protein